MTFILLVFGAVLVSDRATKFLAVVLYRLLTRHTEKVGWALLAACFLTGCTTAPVTPPSTLVAVPAQCPTPNVPLRPLLALEALSANASDEDTVQAYAESLRTCIGYSNQLQIILKAYQ